MRDPFKVLVADPPWQFSDKLPGYGKKKLGRGASAHYATLSIDEICAFPTPRMADDAVLLLWRVSSMPEEALRVCRAWGFTPKSEIVWKKITKTGKPHFGMGRYTRLGHETCIIATRGRGHQVVMARNIRSVFEAPVGEHSAKPELFYRIVEAWLAGPYAELFARRRRGADWSCYGNEVDGRLRGRAVRRAA